MDSLSCILLMVERGERVHAALAKAVTLARYTGACLELFLCDTPYYPDAKRYGAAGERHRQQCLQRGHEYLRALREGIDCTDVDIGSEVACANSLTQGVAEKLRRTAVQLVVRAIGKVDAASCAVARGLVNTCGSPLLLTRGRPWQPAPQFVAALSAGRSAAASTQIGQLSELLRCRCNAQVDYLVANARLLPAVLAARSYDLITLAAAPEDSSPPGPDQTLQLLQSTAADVLLVRARPAAGAAATGRSAGAAAV